MKTKNNKTSGAAAQGKRWLAKVLKTEWCPKFIQAMQDRMVVSFAKYGPVTLGFPAKINALKSLRQRLDKYLETGNTEFLVDAANFAMIEFMHPSLPNAFFEGTDSDQSPGRTSQTGEVNSKANQDEQAANALSKLANRQGD